VEKAGVATIADFDWPPKVLAAATAAATTELDHFPNGKIKDKSCGAKGGTMFRVDVAVKS
jgi:hypothetical protein